MRQYLDLTTWIVLFALLPVTVLILLSQNSIPGDLFYPVKRGLENIILVAASVSPSTKVAFRTDLTQRRFTEAQQLLITKADTTAFSDFVSEVQSTQQDLSTLSSSQDKIQNADKILAKIDEYQNQLTQVQSQVQIAQSLPISQPIQNQPIQNQPTQAPTSATQPLQSQAPAVTPTSASPTPQPQQPVQTQQPTTTSITQTSTPAPVAGSPAPVASPVAPAPLAPSVTNTIANNPQKAEEVKQRIDTTKNELAKIKEEVQKNKEDAQVQEKVKEEQKKLQENLKKEHEQSPNPSSGQ